MRWLTVLMAAVLAFSGCGTRVRPGSPDFRARILKGDMILWTTPVGSGGLNLITIATGARASMQGAWEIITDVEKFPEFLFTMKETRVISMKYPDEPVRSRIVEFVIDAPWPLKDIRMKVQMDCNEETRACDFHAVEGNLKEMYGGFRFEEWDKGYLAITFQAFADLGYDAVPASAVNASTEFMVSSWSRTLRKRLLTEPWVSMPLKPRRAKPAGDINADGLEDLLR